MSYDGKAPHSEQPGREQALQSVTTLELPTSLRVTHVQPLPGGRVLIAGARTQGTDNAEVWDGTGHLELTGLIGDGIAHLLTTPTRAIWAGYFDEGIYGRPKSPAAHGLVRFAPDLTTDWAYPQGQLTVIDDCYALNVADEVATLCALHPLSPDHGERRQGPRPRAAPRPRRLQAPHRRRTRSPDGRLRPRVRPDNPIAGHHNRDRPARARATARPTRRPGGTARPSVLPRPDPQPLPKRFRNQVPARP
jgi:hypothetical protein